jgi:MFS family permease
MPQMPSAVAHQSAVKKHITLGLVAVFLTYFSSGYFFRGASVTAPRIAADLNGMPLFSWSISAPALAAALATLIFGKLSDMYGRRRLLLLSLALYMGGSILSALSQTYVFFIGARVVLSLGQGALAALCFSIVGDMFAPAERSKWSGLLAIPAGISAMTVPTIVGIFTDKLSWRYFFWIAVIIAFVCAIFVLAGVPSRTQRTAHKIDFLGSCLLAAASATMMLGFSWAGSVFSWTSIQIVGLLAVSLGLWAIFLIIETRADEPMLDPHVFTSRTFLTAAVSGFISYFGLLGVQMYVPLFLQGIQGTSATVSGQMITPYSMFVSFMGVPAGLLLGRTKRYKKMYISGYALLTVAMFAMIGFNSGTPFWFTVLITALAGMGLGTIPTMNTLVAQFSVPKRLLGVAVGAMYFFVFMGGAIAPAILGSAMNATYARTLQSTLPAELKRVADEATLRALTDPRVLLSPQAMTALQEAVNKTGDHGATLFKQAVDAIRASLEASLKKIFLIGAVTMLLAFLLIITIPEVSIDVEAKDKRAPR